MHGKINNVKVSYDFEQPSWHDIYVYQANESIGTFKTCGSMKPRKIIEIIQGMLEFRKQKNMMFRMACMKHNGKKNYHHL